MGHPDDDGEERPPFVLMEPQAYFADRDNATTAACVITGFNGTFKLTFCTARPPLVSYTCFHATDYKHTDFAVDPRVLATETDGGLVLLRIVFCDRLSAMNFPHYGLLWVSCSPAGISSSGTSGYWEAKVWSAKRNSSSVKDWHADYEFRSSDIAELPILQVDPGKAQPTLSTLHTDMPNVSLQEDGIVYFLSKVYHCNNDHVAWVLAVNMRNKKIQKVGEFRPTRTVGLADGYSATRISKYLKGTKQNPK